MKGPVRIAIDIGGTFTDLQGVEQATGRTFAYKTPTTPDDPAIGLVNAITQAMHRFDFEKTQISGLMHGTTIATNAVLERNFPQAALLTTAGFEDVLEIGRHARVDVYSQIAEQRPVLIPRHLRFGINERINSNGAVARPLQLEQLTALAEKLRNCQVAVVAICLLNSFSNPAHEDQLAQWVTEQLPGIKVSLSSQVSPEAREYERTSTTALNALLTPVVSSYLDQLAQRLAYVGITAPVFLVQSNGGVTTPQIAAEQPVRLILSGPSGGTRAVEVLAEHLDLPNLIAIDMGGTSFDVSIVRQGMARVQTQGAIDSIPVRTPMLEIRTIGAGGGSLAQINPEGRITVGPQSAGAKPGPVAYGRGGEEPTVTDANIALGRIDPDYFLGGSLKLNSRAASEAIARHIAKPLGISTEQAASGIIDIAVSHMAAAIRLSLFEKGLDPNDFSLVSFGGAGGLHAALVARELGVDQILFPPDAGTQSAWGMLFANVVQDVSQSHMSALSKSAIDPLSKALGELMARANSLLDRAEIERGNRGHELLFDIRYPGQGWELCVSSPYLTIDATTITQACNDFHQLHLEQFAHNEPSVIPEVVTLRLRATGRIDKPSLAVIEPPRQAPEKTGRRVYLNEQWQELSVIDRTTLLPGVSIAGPVIVDDAHSTILLPDRWVAKVHPCGVLIAQHQ